METQKGVDSTGLMATSPFSLGPKQNPGGVDWVSETNFNAFSEEYVMSRWALKQQVGCGLSGRLLMKLVQKGVGLVVGSFGTTKAMPNFQLKGLLRLVAI